MNLPSCWRWPLLLLCLELTLPFTRSFAAEPPPEPSLLVNEVIRPNALEAAFKPLRADAVLEPASLILREIVERTRNAQRSGALPSPQQLREELAELEQWLADFPDSPYAPGVRLSLAGHYRQVGRMTPALAYYADVWAQLQGETEEYAVELANDAALGQIHLWLRLGRREELAQFFAEIPGRVWGPTALAIRLAREAWQTMYRRPDQAFKCGVYAVNNVARQVLGQTLPDVLDAPSTADGFNLQQLSELATANGLSLVPVARVDGELIPIPSVVHWAQNHYAAILQRHEGRYLVLDPTFGYTRWVEAEAIHGEASGYFLTLLSAGTPAGFRGVSVGEAASVWGKGLPYIANDKFVRCLGRFDFACRYGQGLDPCCGMAEWQVSEPNLNLTLTDTPFLLHGGRGPTVRLDLIYDQRRTAERRYLQRYAVGSSVFGEFWVSSWQGVVTLTDFYENESPYTYYGTVVLWNGPSGETPYVFNGATDYSEPNPENGLRLKLLRDGSNRLRGFELMRGDGARMEYAYRDEPFSAYRYFLSAMYDPQGRAVRLGYDRVGSTSTETAKVRLRYLTNAINQVVTLSYNTSNLVSSVSGPGGLQAQLTYTNNHGKMVLQSIQDVVGIQSRFYYDEDPYGPGWPTHLITPYGTTTFQHFDVGDDHVAMCNTAVDRWCVVTEPEGARQVFARMDNGASFDYSGCAAVSLPTTFPNALIPTGLPAGTQLDTSNRHQRGTFYWDRLQSTRITNSTPDFFATADFLKARWRRWLVADYSGILTYTTLSTEQQPRIDANTEGPVTWYDYSGKPAAHLGGDNPQPSLRTAVTPVAGSAQTYYDFCRRNELGNVTNNIERVVTTGGAAAYRTNYTQLETNGIDPKLHFRSDDSTAGWTLEGYYYDTTLHLPLRYTNAVGEVTYFTYTGNAQPYTVDLPSGLRTTYGYDGNGNVNSVVDSISGVSVRSKSYTWSNGLLSSETDERGLGRNHTYDNLGRLLKTTYPDGTGETNLYTLFAGESYPNSTGSNAILDRTASISRLGQTNRFKWNGLRLLSATIDPRGITNLNTYCSCGAIETSVRAAYTAAAETNRYVYDNLGRLLSVIAPDGSSFTNRYDPWGQVTNVSDAFGSLTNYYDTRGRLYAVSNAFGRVQHTVFDRRDRPVIVTDAAGLAVTNTYDALGRIKRSQQAGGGTENFGYTPGYSGPTSYTNQVGNIIRYAYDALNRKTNEIIVGKMTNRFAYNAGSDLTDLWDGKGNRTQWRYDAYGRVLHKVYANNQTNLSYLYDAASRLTNRWSQAKGNTKYQYDRGNNLTNVDYNLSTDLKFQYDALNRVTNMVDASGTTKFTYGQGHLLTEDGPWADDTISYGYQNGLRRTMTIANAGGGSVVITNTYDAMQRLATVANAGGSFGYQFAGAANLIRKISLPGGSYVTNQFDSLGRITDTRLLDSTSAMLNQHGYKYNTAHQRTFLSRTNAANSSWNGYLTNTYDAAGELLTALTRDASGNPVSGQQFSYAYDPAWNLTNRATGTGTSSYAVNVLNQVTNATGLGTVTYDANGNRSVESTSPTWSYTWDDENQLVKAEAPGGSPPERIEFTYDGQKRLRKRVDYMYSGGSWSVSAESRYLYDGLLLVQERDSSNRPRVTYTRGLDLSGSADGAGGIGGLLARSTHSTSSPYPMNGHAFYHADGNGNITALVNASGMLQANYRYDPYGRTLNSSGTLANGNTLRFSSKPVVVTPYSQFGMYYYGYRFYDPLTQRWLNRDPIEEDGGINLYTFCSGNSLNYIDHFGLDIYDDYIDNIELYNNDGLITMALNSVIPIALSEAVSEALAEIGNEILSPSSAIHQTLGVLGMIEGFGVIFDMVDAGMYAVEGDKDAVLVALAATLPIVGQAAAAKRLGLLEKIGQDAWQSSGGLIYSGLDRNGQNRVQHVFRHLVSDPGRIARGGKHSIFNVQRNELLKLLDEAWRMKGAPDPKDRCAYIINMGRPIGTQGETSIRIIVKSPGSSEIITAYPWP